MKTILRALRLFFCFNIKKHEEPIDTSGVKVSRRKGLIWINGKRIYKDQYGRKVCEQLVTKKELQKLKEMNLI